MSWLHTAALAFEADEKDPSEFLTWLLDPDAFDENPSFLELMELCDSLGWTLLELVAYRESAAEIDIPSTLTILQVEAEK